MTPTPTHKALTPAGEWVEGWFDHSVESNPLMIVTTDNYKGYGYVQCQQTCTKLNTK